MTIAAARERIARGGGRPQFIGSPTTVADQIEAWIARGGIDGFLFMPVPQPAGFTELADLLLPERQRRGLHRRPDAGPPCTLRERFFGEGHRRLAADHPGRVGDTERTAPRQS